MWLPLTHSSRMYGPEPTAVFATVSGELVVSHFGAAIGKRTILFGSSASATRDLMLTVNSSTFSAEVTVPYSLYACDGGRLGSTRFWIAVTTASALNFSPLVNE